MRFICDITLGRLTKYLRMFGFDTASIKKLGALETYRNMADPPLLFTKRTKPIPYQPVIFITSNDIVAQLEEAGHIIKPAVDRNSFMTRCIKCNTLLKVVTKEDIEGLVPEYIYHNHKQFKTCPSCKKVYWEGTHTERMRTMLGHFMIDDTDASADVNDT
jgi:hypothetical protein